MKQFISLEKNLALLAFILIISFNTQAAVNHVQNAKSFRYNFLLVPTAQSIVKFVSFNGSIVKNMVLLNWVTSQELNNNYFEIERSFNGKDFTTVGLALDGFENETNKEYAFKDNSKLLENKEVVYYRLKQHDNNGAFSYGTLLTVALKSDNKVDIQFSPNPFTENFNVKFSASENTAADIQVANMLGKSVINKKVSVSKGYNNIQVEGLSSLPKGTYIATVAVNGKVVGSQKIVK